MFVIEANNCSTLEEMFYGLYKHNPKYNNTVLILYHVILPNLISIRNKYNGYKIIICQFEQLFDNHPRGYTNNKNIQLLKDADEVWDLDTNNIPYLAKYGIVAKYHPVVYTKTLIDNTILNTNIHDIDVLFYGNAIERRNTIINNIKQVLPNINLMYINGNPPIVGQQLNKFIARSKIILNIHAYELSLQETVRMMVPLANNKCILSETSMTDNLCECIIQCTTNNLAKYINELLQNKNYIKQGICGGELYKQLHIDYIKENFL